MQKSDLQNRRAFWEIALIVVVLLVATFFWTHRFQAAPGLQHDEIFKANFATYILKGEFPAFFDAAGRALGRGYTSPSGGKRKANERDYALSVFLADEEGNRFGELRRQPLDGDYPTSRWKAGEIGRYRLLVRVFDMETGDPSGI